MTSTGSLGMGVSKARGFVLADRLLGRSGRVYVLTGDGELQEGQFWESLQPTANRRLAEITVIVDHNKVQSDTWVADVSDLGDLEAKLPRVRLGSGALRRPRPARARRDARAGLERDDERPQRVVADTLKGGGVSFMEPHDLPQTDTALYGYHSGAPTRGGVRARGRGDRARLNARLERARRRAGRARRGRAAGAPLGAEGAPAARRPPTARR